MYACRLLTMSAYHISRETFEIMEDGYVYATYYPTEDGGEVHGFFVRADSKWPEEDIPADLEVCMKFALKHNCTWLRLDIDADPSPELQIYDWE